MSSVIQVPSHHGENVPPMWPIEDRRGTYGMYTLITTEASLFVCLFASYYFLANNKDRWATDTPPKLHYALIMLVILLTSSFVLYWGEKQVKAARYAAGRMALWGTVLLGIIFMVIQALEYTAHWKTLTPFSDSYGSVFYALTTFHALHVIMGILLLAYTGLLPNYGPTVAPPYKPYHTVSLYWHFVDVVWIFIVVLLYLAPNFHVYVH